MLATIRTHYKLRKARHEIEREESALQKVLKDVTDAGKRRDLVGEYSHLYIEPAEEEYRALLTTYWVTKARDKFIPVPPFEPDSEYWEGAYHVNKSLLTDKGISLLRTAIRQETASTNETFFKWASIILGLLAVALQLR